MAYQPQAFNQFLKYIKTLPTSAPMVSLLIGPRNSGIAAGKECLGFKIDIK